MWNDEKWLSISLKKILIYIVSIIISLLALYIGFHFFIPTEAKTEDYISIIAVVLTIIGFIFSINNQLISRQKSTDIYISLDTNISGNDAIISCIVENKGLDTIKNMSFYVFVDQPILNEATRVYEYNHILEHECDRDKCKHKKFCRLSEKCIIDSNESIQQYPIELVETIDDRFYGFKRLDFLSDSSVMYINSGERFVEDITFNLKEGIYRAILLGRYNRRKKSCLCTNKQFIIRTMERD